MKVKTNQSAKQLTDHTVNQPNQSTNQSVRSVNHAAIHRQQRTKQGKRRGITLASKTLKHRQILSVLQPVSVTDFGTNETRKVARNHSCEQNTQTPTHLFVCSTTRSTMERTKQGKRRGFTFASKPLKHRHILPVLQPDRQWNERNKESNADSLLQANHSKHRHILSVLNHTKALPCHRPHSYH